MCTVGILFRVHPDYPVILAHNRDEMRTRASTRVEIWRPDGASVDVLGGRDDVSGGSWFLVGPKLVASVTNHHSQHRSPPGRRSRGELVTSCATALSLGTAERWLKGLEGQDFGGFHLLVSDGARMMWASNAKGSIELQDVPPGAHALRNTTLNDPHDPVTGWVREQMASVSDVPWTQMLVRLQQMLGVAAPSGPFVDLGGYGTRSAGVLGFGGVKRRYVATDDPPTEGGWVEHSDHFV